MKRPAGKLKLDAGIKKHMSKPVNPYSIGVFLVGALALAVIALLIFGGGQFLKTKEEYVIYFDSALNGLKIGAPVTLEGVQIGAVIEIALEFDQQTTHIIKPVVIEINQELMLRSNGLSLQAASSTEESRRNVKQLIDAGLRAQLKTQSMLTGLLYVEFNFHRNDAIKLSKFKYKNLEELPSVQSTEDKIMDTADEIMAKFRNLPIEAIANDLAATLKSFREIATSEDVKQDRAALNKTLLETEKLVSRMDLATNDIRTMVQQFTRDSRPVMIATEKTLDTAKSVLLEFNRSLYAMEALAEPDAPLLQSLEELRGAAQSARNLTDYLEQHPEAIIFGKR
ncbi:MlaD family protein [Candidatus Methylospira mobilis]|nr:MlaD family protein [Candidatus Methylospira mobilis]